MTFDELYAETLVVKYRSARDKGDKELVSACVRLISDLPPTVRHLVPKHLRNKRGE